MRQSEQPEALQSSNVSSRLLRSQGLLRLQRVQGCSAGSPVVPVFPLILYVDSRSESSKQLLLSCGLMEVSWRIQAPEHPTEGREGSWLCPATLLQPSQHCTGARSPALVSSMRKWKADKPEMLCWSLTAIWGWGPRFKWCEIPCFLIKKSYIKYITQTRIWLRSSGLNSFVNFYFSILTVTKDNTFTCINYSSKWFIIKTMEIFNDFSHC